MKAPKNIYTATKDEGIIEVPFDKACTTYAKENNFKPKEFMEAMADAIKGKGLDSYPDLEPEEVKHWKPIYAAAAKLLKDSEKNKQDLNAQLQEAEDEAKKKSELIKKGAEEGVSAAQKMEVSVISGIQKLVGEDFVASPYGLTVAKGVTLTPDSMSHAVNGLLNGAEAMSKGRTMYLTRLGDAVNIARNAWGEEEGDSIIAQAIPVEGQGKHNVLQAASVMAYVDALYPDQKDRPDMKVLTFTHLQEAKNYGRNKDGTNAIQPAKVRAILKKATDENLSCAETRELLKAARPKDETQGSNGSGEEGEGKETGEVTEAAPTASYLYVNLTDFTKVHTGAKLVKELLTKKTDEGEFVYHVLDLRQGVILDEKGKVAAKFSPVEDALAEASDLPE